MNYKEIEQLIAGIDITLPPPEKEPERQYYFIRKLREWMDEKKKEKGKNAECANEVIVRKVETE